MEKSKEKRSEIHPVLLRKITLVLNAMEALNLPMAITGNPVRSAEVQNALYQIGRTKPGKIVTNADGYEKKSNHQLGHAVDCHFIVDGKPAWNVPDSYWNAYGALCIAVGLEWGGSWKSFIDRPHAELKRSF